MRKEGKGNKELNKDILTFYNEKDREEDLLE